MIWYVAIVLGLLTCDAQAETKITPAMMMDSVKEAIYQEVDFEDFDVQLLRPKKAFAVKDIALDSLDFSVENLSLSPETRRFQGTFIARDEDGEQRATAQISGRVKLMVTIPVLRQPIGPAVKIQDGDLALLRFPADKLRPTSIRYKQDLIGKESRNKVLQPGKPLFVHDVRAPILVKRGEMVTITYRSGAMLLTAKAKARQQGSLGDTIDLERKGARALITGTVSGRNHVDISPIGASS